MGIYDRDYFRDDRAPRGIAARTVGIGGWRMWSVTTWIIVICGGVYVIDGFLPETLVLLERRQTDRWSEVEGIDPDTLPLGPVIKVQGEYLRPLLAPDAANRKVVVAYNVYTPMRFLEGWLHFSTKRGFLGLEWWRFIGFQFLHGSPYHLLINMIVLYFFGPIVERYLGSKRYLAFYLLCGIFGAIMYLILNLAGLAAAQMFGQDVSIPGLLFNRTSLPLIGASAGVYGVIMAGAYLAPNATVLLFFLIPMRLVTLAYAMVIFSVFFLITGSSNAGGDAGHIGGAIAGFYFIRRPHHLHGFFDILGRVDPTSHHYRKSRPAKARRGEIDRVLDKISQRGIHSLTEREKKLLRRASEEGRT